MKILFYFILFNAFKGHGPIIMITAMKELFRQTVYWGNALISVEFSQIKMFNLNLESKNKVVIYGLIS